MPGQKGRAGGVEGRVGGRLSAGSRAQKNLAKAPKVKVLGGLSGALRAPLQQAAPNYQAAAGAARAMSALLGLSPASSAAAAKVAAAAVAASAAPGPSSGAGASAGSVGQGLAAAPRQASSGKRKAAEALPSLPFQIVKRRPVSATSSGAALTEGKRGAVVAVKPAATYGAGKSYFWKDVVEVANRSHDKTLSAPSPLVSCASRLERKKFILNKLAFLPKKL